MKSDYLQAIYIKMGEQLNPDESYFEQDSRFATIEQILRSVPKGRFLDIGCGRGLLLRRLSDHHECFGCDFDPTVVSTNQKAGLAVCQTDLNSGGELDERFPRSYNVAVISEVCEHLLNPRGALRLANRYLAPGARLIVTVPNAVPLFVRLYVLLGFSVGWLHYPSDETETTGHIRFYTIDSMSRLLATEGFSVDAVCGVSFRMNGRFWERICYWVPRLLQDKRERTPARIDALLGKWFPSLSPGLLFECKRKEDVSNTESQR